MTFAFHREDGTEVVVTAKKSRGEAGSASIVDTVEIVGTADVSGNVIEPTDAEFAEMQREAEKLLS